MSKFDPATDALMLAIHEQHGKAPEAKLLWLADEHPIDPARLDALPKKTLLFISNRFDQYQLAQSKGIPSRFADFQIHTEDQPLRIFLRTPKERALTHFQINQSFKYLPTGGQLWLFGYKNEGIKTHIAKAASLFGGKAMVAKGKNQLSIACLEKLAKNNTSLDDDNYDSLRQITINELPPFWSKPGIYGWNKIDAGSKLLVDTLAIQQKLNPGAKILDIGCGYGYLSLWAKQQNPSLLTATDNCYGALEAAKQNLQAQGQILPSNAADCIEGEYDLILCNPPFHQGFSTTSELHQRFLSNTRRLLAPRGTAWFVVNQFLPLDKLAATNGLVTDEITRADGFKVLRLGR